MLKRTGSLTQSYTYFRILYRSEGNVKENKSPTIKNQGEKVKNTVFAERICTNANEAFKYKKKRLHKQPP